MHLSFSAPHTLKSPLWYQFIQCKWEAVSHAVSLSLVHEELWTRNGVTGTDYRWAHAKASWGSEELGMGQQAVVGMAMNTGQVHRLLDLEPLFRMWQKYLRMRGVSLENWIWLLVLHFPASWLPLLMKSCILCCFFHLRSWGITCPSEPSQRDTPSLLWDPPPQPSAAQEQLLA